MNRMLSYLLPLVVLSLNGLSECEDVLKRKPRREMPGLSIITTWPELSQ
jgi:hypothetical protein